MTDNLRFVSAVGHQPWFFVPDTGAEGGTAVVVGPGKAKTAVVETQVTVDGRVGFRVPFPFVEPGDYSLTVTQDDVVTTYEIEVPEEKN